MPENIAIDLAREIKREVTPYLEKGPCAEVVGKGASGDMTFRVDLVAEEVVRKFISKRGTDLAYYSEEKGLIKSGLPKQILIIDPIDGSRGAKIGFPSCVVSVGVAEYKETVKLKDIFIGCILDLMDDLCFYAERGKGASVFDGEKELEVSFSKNRSLDSLCWSLEITGRPSKPIFDLLGELVDRSSLAGGVFTLASTCYSITRILRGQLDAFVDIGNRMLKEFPHLRPEFLKAGKGAVVGLFPYDIAAVSLIAKEAGCIITDAYGRGLDDTLMTNSAEDNIQSLVAANSKALHREIIDFIDLKFKELKKSECYKGESN